jgi:pimeloyl-ACP methyl ester carboxylesterase
MRVPGGELYYEAEGDGVVVVLVQGLALDARMWDDQVPALKDIARVVRYDVRGFGRSTRDADTSCLHADDLWRLLDQLEVDKAVLVGLSMGGRIVVEATLAAPERVRALVLLDAVLDGVAWDADSERGMRAIGDGLRAGSPRWSATTAACTGPARTRMRRTRTASSSWPRSPRQRPFSPASWTFPVSTTCPTSWPTGFPARANSRFRASGTWSTWKRPRR